MMMVMPPVCVDFICHSLLLFFFDGLSDVFVVLVLDDLEDRHEEDPEVKEELYMICIPVVHADAVVPFDGPAAVHLSPAGDAGL